MYGPMINICEKLNDTRHFRALQNNLRENRPSGGETKILFEYFCLQMGGNDSDVKRMTQKNL